MKADVKSSGIAAPVAQSRQPGGLGISLANFSPDLKDGVDTVMLMSRCANALNTTAAVFAREGEAA